MIDNHVLRTTGRAFEALDLSDYNRRLAKVEASLEGATDAQERTRSRINELHALIRLAGDTGRVDGTATAQAMLEGYDASDAAKASSTVAEMRNEVAIMNDAFKQIGQRIDEMTAERKTLLGEARTEVAKVAKPLTEAIQTELRNLGEQIEALHATMQAVHAATECHWDDSMKVEAALLGVERVVGYKRTVRVSGEIVEVMAKLHGKGPVLPIRVLEQASWPNPLIHTSYNRGGALAA